MSDDLETLWAKWRDEPTSENYLTLFRAVRPTVVSEAARHGGEQNVLRAKGKVLADKAIRSYNPESGARLRSWVVTQLQPLRRVGAKLRSPVSAPEALRRQAAELAETARQMRLERGRDPSDEELADRVGVSTKLVERARSAAPAVVSESSLSTDDESELTSPAVELGDERSELSEAADMVRETLSDRDRAIFDLRTGRGGETLSNQEVAARLGVSPGLVSQRGAEIADKVRGAANG